MKGLTRDSNQGYVADTLYEDRYFKELSPAWLNRVVEHQGIPPIDLNAPFRYLELGCGLGHSITTHAACFPEAQFYACDFNSAQIQLASEQAHALGLRNLTLWDKSFADLLQDETLPAMDFIVLHGVFSWVADTDRQRVLDIANQLLAPNGIVYVSYNALPGWNDELPLRKLMVSFAQSSEGNSAEKALSAVQQMKNLAPSLVFCEQNKAVQAALEDYQGHSGEYLAHEFLNEAWVPFYATDLHEQWKTAGFQFAGSANMIDREDALVFTDEIRKILSSVASKKQALLLQDMAINRRFRRDVFVRQSLDVLGETDQERLVGLPVHLNELTSSVRVPRGNIFFESDFIDCIKRQLVEGPLAYKQFISELGQVVRNRAELTRNVNFMIATGLLAFYERAPIQSTDALEDLQLSLVNERILQRIIDTKTPRAFASPELGIGVEVSVRVGFLLQAWLDDNFTEEEMLAHGEALFRDEFQTNWEAPTLDINDEVSSFYRNLLPDLRRLAILS